MVDLSTTYLGLNLRSPLVVGAAALLLKPVQYLQAVQTYQPRQSGGEVAYYVWT